VIQLFSALKTLTFILLVFDIFVLNIALNSLFGGQEKFLELIFFIFNIKTLTHSRC